jgi:hypothetical protein
VKKKSFRKRPSGRTSINIGELKIGVEVGPGCAMQGMVIPWCNDVGYVMMKDLR